MGKARAKLTLDQVATYQIKVPGLLDNRRVIWDMDMIITTENDDHGLPVTTLVGTVDQAALLSLLRRLYSLGLPLIAVDCVDYDC
jgi:hypothetical protein